MTAVVDFAAKLDCALKAMSLSRVALAQALGVDKSLVGRWLAGSVHPTEHNLSRLTALVADHSLGFRMADWYLDAPAFADRFGVQLPSSGNGRDDAPMPEDVLGPLGAFIAQARRETEHHGAAYEGFWRTSRPSLLMPEQMFHDYGMIRRGRDGLLKVRMRGAGLAFDGFALPVGSNLYAFLYDPTGGTPMSLTFKGVTLPRAMVLEGLLLLAALDANRTPAAVPIVLERVADLTADRVADNARFAALESEAPAPLDPVVPEALAARLYRPVGGGNSDGREPFLSVGSLAALSRGATSAGLRG